MLTDEEREQLVRWSRRAKSSQALALRSRIVLACAEGLDNKTVAARVGCVAGDGRQVAGPVRRADRLDGLVDEPRPGRPPSITARPGRGRRGRHAGVHAGERDALVAGVDGRSAAGCRKSTIGRIWKAFELKPHRADGFKLSTDPLFVEKVYDVVGLYLDPPESAVVLCVDEKSQVQALDRSQPALPMMPGMPEKRTHDYVRHGITSLFAAFNIADGTVISPLHRRHRAVEFKKFLTTIDAEVPDDLDVHLVCDNYATHKTPAITTGSPNTPASTCTSPRPAPPGSTRSNAGSATSPTSCSDAATTEASRPSKPTSATGSQPGTRPQAVRLDQDRRRDPRLTRPTSSTNLRRRTLALRVRSQRELAVTSIPLDLPGIPREA